MTTLTNEMKAARVMMYAAASQDLLDEEVPVDVAPVRSPVGNKPDIQMLTYPDATRSYWIPERGRLIGVHSTVSCSRSLEAFTDAVGTHVQIGLDVYPILAVEMFQSGTPLMVGEAIGILIEPDRRKIVR